MLDRKLVFFIKYGFDGTNVHPYNNHISVEFNHVICTSMVPLKLIDQVTQAVVWENKFPNSSRWCRPIRIQFGKESKELVLNETKRLKEQINNLEMCHVGHHKINCDMKLTMVDGKVSKK